MNNSCETKESCLDKMGKRLKGFIPHILGMVIGGVGGFIYYYKIGCVSGSCPITSNPYLSILWGAAMGYLIVDLLSKKKSKATV